jgi:predicted XRE-type DNA-binding protein
MAKKRSRDQLAKVLRPVDHVPLIELKSDKPWREKVWAFLESHDMNQQDLAEWIGVAQSVVSNVISDTNKQFKPRHEIVGKISEAVGIGLPVAARMDLAVQRAQDAGHPEVADAAALSLEALIEHLLRQKKG